MIEAGSAAEIPEEGYHIFDTPDGPWIVDIQAAMKFAVENGAFSHDTTGVLA